MNKFYKIIKTKEHRKERKLSLLEKFTLEQIKDYGALSVISEIGKCEEPKNPVLTSASTIPESDSTYIELKRKMHPLTLRILGSLGYSIKEMNQEQYHEKVFPYPV